MSNSAFSSYKETRICSQPDAAAGSWPKCLGLALSAQYLHGCMSVEQVTLVKQTALAASMAPLTARGRGMAGAFAVSAATLRGCRHAVQTCRAQLSLLGTPTAKRKQPASHCTGGVQQQHQAGQQVNPLAAEAAQSAASAPVRQLK